MKKNFLDISELSTEDINYILELGLKVKKNPQNYYDKLKHKKAILLLEKNSTRTQVSFDLATQEMGGIACVLNKDSTQIARGESIADTAKVLDRYSDFIVFRTSSHSRLTEMANNCTQAVTINALTDHSHPCQIMADVMTIIEHFGSVSGKKVCWVGDVNNVMQSWIEAAEKLDFQLNICCPHAIRQNCANRIRGNRKCELFDNKKDAAKGCSVVTTDTWVSMGCKKENMKLFEGLTVDRGLMECANHDAIFLHCLPAHRDWEVSSEVLDDPKYSKIVFDEAENRLHIQKAIMMWCSNII